jgi:periplasmic copper chaperone A
MCPIHSDTGRRDSAAMTIHSRYVLPAVIAVALTLVAGVAMVRGEDTTAGTLEVVKAWARATPPNAKVGAAYLTLRNNGESEDRLVEAASPAAAKIEAHETIEDNGVAKMRPAEALSLPPGGELAMKPGGTHLMLMDLAGPLKEGTHFPLTLTFAKGGPLTVEVEVAPLGAGAPMSHDHHSM